ncbi:putative phosphatidylinositol (3,5) kinase [Trypanosoma rangeli]|uniref:Putative phosphatidylinositol (3,5) kinase n=1 Tax=Trypanosoma rangeli TaxID=5698 RepID=A0A422NHD9_TRYRA|nr:putative phosphatidylinositol (3,5) kinase [Trypanosoma rangeli]RNF04886.1 putative phosphatidylinositol (3,5) kinase [Trypanosoma rangeli]|eukprot:RNF04886.1 putative phosphatidylinositol (3,5) kinase [Trypanosoma rangeli]
MDMQQEQAERSWGCQGKNVTLRQALWVDDRYAVRCRGCDARFNVMRRRHHCRNCGQVFCSECLITSSTSRFGNILTGVLSSLVGLHRDPLVKLCHKCDRLLRKRSMGQQQGWWRVLPPQRGLLEVPTAANAAAVTHEGGSGGKLRPNTAATTTTTTADAASVGANTRMELPRPLEGSLDMPPASAPPLREDQFLSLSGTVLSGVLPQSWQPCLPTHPEDVSEQKISCGLTDTPMYSRNSVADGVAKLFKKTRNCKMKQSPEQSQIVCLSRTYTPHPKATFRRADVGHWSRHLATVFSHSISKSSLQRLEAQCSYHLIKRVSRLFMKEEALATSSGDIAGMDRVQWIAGLCDISWHVVSQLSVVLHERIDQRLEVICIPGGKFADTEIVTGVAFIQNIAFKRMKTLVASPRLLLLAGDVGTTLSPRTNLLEYVEGYEGHLDTQYQRIHIWRPSVIVVEGNMHHYLQDKILRQSDATLILHVGNTILQRLSRCCEASIISDLQYIGASDLYDDSVLGTCESFQVVHHGDRPVCIFKAPQVALFTAVLLRGADEHRLTIAKELLLNCAATAYHLALQAHCMFDLGVRCAELHPIPLSTTRGNDSSGGGEAEDSTEEEAEEDEERKEEDYTPSAWGEASSADSRQCGAYMQFVTHSPRAEDRLETLSMNTGVAFPHEVLSFNEKYDDLMVDSIIVNTVFLEYVAGGLPGEETVGGAAAAPDYSVRQSREVLPFYKEGDETLLEFLTERAKEGDSVRLIVHANKRIWVKTCTDFNNAHIQRTEFGQGESLLPPALTKSFMSLHTPGTDVDGAYVLFVKGYVVCKDCFHGMGSGSAGSLAAACSLHTLNLSWGAFLELLIYGSSTFTVSCRHDPSQGICVSFCVFPRTRREVMVNIVVEPLTVYDIVTPPVTMPACIDTVEMYLKNEKEELLRSVGSIAAAAQAMTASQAQQQQLVQQLKSSSPPSPSLQSPQSRSIKPSLASLLSRCCSALGEAAEFDAEKGVLLLQRAEELLRLIPLLKTREALTLLRLNELADLMVEFLEWYKHGTLLAERRSGRPPSLVELTAFEDYSWAYCPRENCGLRLNEPSSLVALALQALSLSPGSRCECLSGLVRSDLRSFTQPASRECAPIEQEATVVDTADGGASLTKMEEQTQVLLEDSMGLCSALSPPRHQNFSPLVCLFGLWVMPWICLPIAAPRRRRPLSMSWT